jgi:TonB-linked SusC/RagA family outer membrane protein
MVKTFLGRLVCTTGNYASLIRWRYSAAVLLFLLFAASVNAQRISTLTDSTSKANTAGSEIVSGIIYSAATGKPAPAVNVSVPDFSATLTDDYGKFSLKVPSLNATLFVSAEGFQSKEFAIKGRRMLLGYLYEESFNSGYDNVVHPFGSKPKNQTVNAISSINTEGNWSHNMETPDAYLQGRAAGVKVTLRSGTPNAGASIMLRGYNTLYATHQPLFVVDGMIYDNTDIGASLFSGHYTNPLAQIDAKDIENITVIKDGSSLYGTKAANGVIIITTTHATQQATKIDLAVYGGVNFAPQKMPVLKAADYRTYLSELLKSGGMGADQIQQQPYMNDNTSNPDYYRYHNETDWQDVAFRNAATSNVYLKITGGDNIAKYALSIGYQKNAGITDNTNLSRYNVRFNADLNLSKRLTASANLSYSYYEQLLKDQGLAMKTNPILLSLIKAPFVSRNEIADNGSVSPNFADTDIFGVSNPAAAISTIRDYSKVYRFFGAINFKYSFSPSLSLGTLVGVTVDEVREQLFIPRKGIADDTLTNAIADSRLGGQTKRIFSLYNDTYLDFSKTLNRIHRLQLRAGIRFLNNNNERDVARGYNSATDEFISVGTGVSTLRQVGGDIGKYNWVNMYAGAEYGLANKYFLSLNAAVDGSSRFGTDVPKSLHLNNYSFAVMPSVGASWLLSSENFMAGASFIELLKLRATYSKSGNDDIGNYNARQRYASQNLLGLQGLVRSNIGNPALQWESVQKVNLGVDAAFMKERLSISADFFQNQTNHMLTFEPLLTASGFESTLTNSGSMQTKGIDLSITGRVTNFGGAVLQSKVGARATEFYGFTTNGVFISDAEAVAAGLSKRTADGSLLSSRGGDIRFNDLNGDRIIDEADRKVIGKADPDYFGSFFGRLTWKGLSLDAFFTFSQGNQLYNGVRAMLESQSTTSNQLQSVAGRWRGDGQITNMPKAAFGDPMGNAAFSDRWIEDGSFLRLRSLSLSYQLPVKPAKAFKYITLYATGNNLLTFTKYLGFDPEFVASESIFSKGIDVGMEPNYRSVTGGLRIGL